MHSIRRFSSDATLCLLTAAMLLLTGCKTDNATKIYPPPETMPAYSEIAGRYNANVDLVKQLWARCRLRMHWTDREGEQHEDTADDSKIIARLPEHEVAVVVGHSAPGVGMLFWAGCNDERYWLFDMRDKEKKHVVWGHHRNLNDPRTRRLNLPIHPLQLPALLGLQPIREDAGSIAWDKHTGSFILQPEGQAIALKVDPRTAVARQVELLNDRGEVVMTATLSQPKVVRREGTNVALWPTINEEVVAEVAGEHRDRLEISFVTITVDPTSRQLNDRQFDLEKLVAALKPHTIEQVDEAAPAPAE